MKKLKDRVLTASGSNPPDAEPPDPSCALDGSRKLDCIWLTLLGSNEGCCAPPLEGEEEDDVEEEEEEDEEEDEVLPLLLPELPPIKKELGLMNIFGLIICDAPPEEPLELPLVDVPDDVLPEVEVEVWRFLTSRKSRKSRK